MPRNTQQSIAAVSARKFRQSTGSVLKSTGEENCMTCMILNHFDAVVDIGTVPEISQDPTQTSTVDESAWINAKVEQIDSDQHGDYLEPNSEKIYREKVR